MVLKRFEAHGDWLLPPRLPPEPEALHGCDRGAAHERGQPDHGVQVAQRSDGTAQKTAVFFFSSSVYGFVECRQMKVHR